MHLPFGAENRDLGWIVFPGGFVSPSRLGPQKASSALLLFSWAFFPAVENPTGFRSGFIVVVDLIAQTLVSSPAASPCRAMPVFPRQI